MSDRRLSAFRPSAGLPEDEEGNPRGEYLQTSQQLDDLPDRERHPPRRVLRPDSAPGSDDQPRLIRLRETVETPEQPVHPRGTG